MLKKWKYALCLHPMYWIIAHDTLCAEREPPWGEDSIEKYIDRCRRNLASMDAHPEVRFGFDFSGLELEDLAKRAPDESPSVGSPSTHIVLPPKSRKALLYQRPPALSRKWSAVLRLLSGSSVRLLTHAIRRLSGAHAGSASS